MFTRVRFNPRSQLRQAFEIAFPLRGRNPLYLPLQLACGPGYSGHTDVVARSFLRFISGGLPSVPGTKPVATEDAGLDRCLT